jgi:hypothetical protein
MHIHVLLASAANLPTHRHGHGHREATYSRSRSGTLADGPSAFAQAYVAHGLPAAVGALTGLRALDLTNNWAITDDGVGALTGLRELESLNLTGSNQARNL